MKKRRSEPKTRQEKRREEKKRQEKGREGKTQEEGGEKRKTKKIYKKVSTFNNWTCLTCGVCWPSSSLLFFRHFFGRMV